MNSNTTRTSKAILVSLFFAGMLFTAPAMAGENQTHAFDANGDGKITFEEVMKKLEKSARTTFDTMDHNKDGVLSEKDFDDAREGMRKLEDWLYDLIKPFMEDDKSDPKAV
ncbi:MAG: EF-hand domain-containing protein [Mariprofundus sp.]|nr:EF-hand domain-containing protein [Mariprofundus sp.]